MPLAEKVNGAPCYSLATVPLLPGMRMPCTKMFPEIHPCKPRGKSCRCWRNAWCRCHRDRLILERHSAALDLDTASRYTNETQSCTKLRQRPGSRISMCTPHSILSESNLNLGSTSRMTDRGTRSKDGAGGVFSFLLHPYLYHADTRMSQLPLLSH